MTNRRVALIGNPNTGKTTLFNALTGLSQRVGNYPGVTVEKKTGTLAPGVELLDLPGTYSLAAHSPDEAVAVRALLGDLAGEAPPDLIVVIVDASNLPRNLYLVTQLLELGRPLVVALNMLDAALAAGVTIDVPGLSQTLGVPVVPLVASRGEGIGELRTAISERVEGLRDRGIDGIDSEERNAGAPGRSRFTGRSFPQSSFPHSLNPSERYAWIEKALAGCLRHHPVGPSLTDRLDRVLAHRYWGLLFFAAVMTLMFVTIFQGAAPVMDLVRLGFGWLAEQITGLFAGTGAAGGVTESLLVHGVIAGVGSVLAFLPQIALLFLFLALLEDCGYLARAALLMDRVLRRCGLSGHCFIPLMSCFACSVPGILATRTIANPRDRLVTILIAPLMACAARLPIYALIIAAFVPARTVAGFLPLQGLVFTSLYFLGILVAVGVALVLKGTLLKDPSPGFIMELPAYRRPTVKNVAFRVWHGSRAFLTRAGTLIFALSIVVWALSYFPHPAAIAAAHDQQRRSLVIGHSSSDRDTDVIGHSSSHASTDVIGHSSLVIRPPTALDGQGGSLAKTNDKGPMTNDSRSLEARLADLDRRESGEYLRQSFFGRAGRFIEPAVRPLGWDWRIGMAVLSAFPAREVVISTLQITYDLGEAAHEGGAVGQVSQLAPSVEQTALVERLRAATWPDGRPIYTLPVALSIVVFFALCCQCGATLATIRRETHSWRWPAFAFVYLSVLAYLGAWVTYQVGTMVGG